MVPRGEFRVLRVLGVLAVLVLFLVPALDAQQRPRFVSAAVRASTAPPDSRVVARVAEDGGYVATNVTLKRLIENAIQRSAFDRREVTGGPDWIGTGRFDVTATATGLQVDPDGFPRESLRMLQTLIQERFQVRWHVEDQLREVYVLTSTGKATPGLVPSILDCKARMEAAATGAQGGKMCGAAPYPGRLIANGIGMLDLAGLMTRWLDRPVIDRTGLRGQFDVDVEGVEFRPAGPFGPSLWPSETKRSVVEHIRPQLGLALEKSTAPVEVYVIDGAVRPS